MSFIGPNELFLLVILGIIIYFIVKAAKGRPVNFSHWHQLIDNLQLSSQHFYTSVTLNINERKLPDTKISRVDHHEGGVLSAKREYLRVTRKEHIFDICAAPFAKGFFISWWLGEDIGSFLNIVIRIPFLGPALIRIFRPDTYYRIDTALMFQESVHASVLEILEQSTKTQGLRSLSELERKPILRDLFKR
ncbi:MAG: hypothetical protein HZB59_06910 [Ignavibacteriales bacterium]|nr:hypothetical protein [Ignavibacteriales bacterium]